MSDRSLLLSFSFMFDRIETHIVESKQAARKIGPGFFVAAALMGGAAYAFLSGREDDLQVVLYGVAVLLLLLGAGILFTGLKSADTHPLLKQLHKDSAAVLWVVPVRLLRNGQHMQTRLEIHFADGTEFKVQLPKNRALEWLEDFQSCNEDLLVGGGRSEYDALRAARVLAASSLD